MGPPVTLPKEVLLGSVWHPTQYWGYSHKLSSHKLSWCLLGNLEGEGCGEDPVVGRCPINCHIGTQGVLDHNLFQTKDYCPLINVEPRPDAKEKSPSIMDSDASYFRSNTQVNL